MHCIQLKSHGAASTGQQARGSKHGAVKSDMQTDLGKKQLKINLKNRTLHSFVRTLNNFVGNLNLIFCLKVFSLKMQKTFLTTTTVSIFLILGSSCFVSGLSRDSELVLDYKTADELSKLPLECYNKEFPYKSSIVFNGTDDVQVRMIIYTFGFSSHIKKRPLMFSPLMCCSEQTQCLCLTQWTVLKADYRELGDVFSCAGSPMNGVNFLIDLYLKACS